MNYQKTLAYIMDQLPMYQRLGKLAYRSGLDNTRQLDTFFQSPHRHFRTIHIAGTNGKGSVSHMLASILQEAGYKVGLYTSPHLVDFRERIKINGNMIPRKFVSEFIREYKSYFDSFNPSFFEILVYMAFLYFVKNKVDIAVIEVGLGGRLDATNIITPELAVITNIGLDHTDILGNSLEKIAAEKAGIIKKNRPVIIGETQDITLPVFSAIADNMHAPLYVADQLFQINYSLLSVDNYQVFNVKKNGEICYINLKCGLLGHYQRKNTVTVLGAVDLLQKNGLKIRERDIYAGIRKVIPNTGLMGRWQIIRHHPTVICDTAHNADGIRWVLEQVTGIPHQTLHLLLGFVNDKNIQEILKYMPVNAHYYFNRLSVPRTMDEHKLAAMAQQHNLKGDAYTHIREAMNDLMKTAGPNDLAVITGSNFLVADFLEIQGKKMEK